MNEHDFVTDDDIDEMYGEQGQQRAVPQVAPQITPIAPGGVQPIGSIDGLPIYPLALAQVPSATTTPGDNFLTRRYGPLPVWGWALTAIGTGLGGYFLWQSSQKKVARNDGEDDETPVETAEESGGGGQWRPSRGAFCDQLERFFAGKGLNGKMRIFDDADDAKAKGLKHLSPLINIKCEVAFKPDRDLERLCKREGLRPQVHADGTVGLYPAENTKRGRAWEKYIDLLRDDGQKV